MDNYHNEEEYSSDQQECCCCCSNSEGVSACSSSSSPSPADPHDEDDVSISGRSYINLISSSTDLRLGLGRHTCDDKYYSVSSTKTQLLNREKTRHRPPIKPSQILRSTTTTPLAAGRVVGIGSGRAASSSLFVKVYMQGIPIGRKLDIFAHRNYHHLVSTLQNMFGTTIFSCPDIGDDHVHEYSEERGRRHYNHVLTYEDKQGDWMMVGDVPWEMFVATVKRLEIRRSSSDRNQFYVM